MPHLSRRINFSPIFVGIFIFWHLNIFFKNDNFKKSASNNTDDFQKSENVTFLSPKHEFYILDK